MRPMPPPPATPPRPLMPRYPWLPVTRLRVGRAVLLLLVTFVALVGGTIWLLMTKARPFAVPTLDSTAWPAWMRQATTYPTAEPEPSKPAEPASDPLAGLNAKLAQMLTELERQRQELEALKKR